MISGREAYSLIDSNFKKTRAHLEGLANVAKRQTDVLADLRKSEVEIIIALAKTRLDLLDEGEISKILKDADASAKKLLADHDRLIEEIKTQIVNTELRIETMEVQRDRERDELDQVTSVFEKAEARTLERLEQTPVYRDQVTAVEEALAIAERAANKLEIARTDKEEKAVAYDSDPLFHYLWKRKYGTSGYRAWPLTRMLDGWVAKLCQFRDARPNYVRLCELPLRLEEHADHVSTKADQERYYLVQMERGAMAEDGVDKLLDAVDAVAAKIESIDNKTEQEENALEVLNSRHSQLVSGAEGPYAEATAIQQKAIDDLPLPDLRILASESTTLADDQMVEDMLDLDRQMSELVEVINETHDLLRRGKEMLENLNYIRRRFRNANFDSSTSTFDAGSVIINLLDAFASGLADRDETWSRIESRHKKKPTTNWGTSSSKTRRSPVKSSLRRRPSGGFRTGGGSRGGGFRTGGGF